MFAVDARCDNYCIVSFVWVLSTALKNNTELFVFPPKMIPDQAVWRNFIDAWRLIDFPRSFFNSFMVSVPTALLTVVVCSMAAYAMTRMKFKYATAVFMIYLSTMMIPMVVRLIPSFILVKNMGLMNTYLGLIFTAYCMVRAIWNLFDPSIFSGIA